MVNQPLQNSSKKQYLGYGYTYRGNSSGPGCSKLTMSLVNILLKFQMQVSNIYQYFLLFFLLKKCEKLLQCKSFLHFFNKNISVFVYKVIKHLTS